MELTDNNFEKEVLKANTPVLVDFWGSWCPPCKMIEPILDKLEKQYMGKIKIGKLNVDRNPVTSAKYNIKGVPTFIIFQKEKMVGREVGAKSEKQLNEMIKTTLENARKH